MHEPNIQHISVGITIDLTAMLSMLSIARCKSQSDRPNVSIEIIDIILVLVYLLDDDLHNALLYVYQLCLREEEVEVVECR